MYERLKINMKKIILSFVLTFVFSSSLYAEKATIGLLGDSCSIFKDLKESYPREEFENHVQAEIMGFLTAYNLYPKIHIDLDYIIKKLSDDSADHAYVSVIKHCDKYPDDAAFIGIINYIDTLPDYY